MELYIHIPFCIKKCDYCDFLSFPSNGEVRGNYCNALISEMEHVSEGKNEEITSIFIGGGTPSILEESLFEKLWSAVRENFSLTKDCEITIEANPGTLTFEKVSLYRQSGINRMSIGCQSTHNEELKSLGRIHTYEEFLESYHLARKAGFHNINVDLMSAIPEQNLESWEENLRRIIALKPEHISAYSLIVEEGTPFYERQLNLPPEEEERQMYECTGELLSKAGYDRYEISNYARKGFACKHNIGYWQRENYLGLGLGAASLVDNRRFSNTREMKKYLDGCGQPEAIRENRELLSAPDQMEEFMFLGLRMMEGVSKMKFKEIFHRDLESVYGAALEKMTRTGLLEVVGDRVRLTEEGISLSNTVFVEFLFD